MNAVAAIPKFDHRPTDDELSVWLPAQSHLTQLRVVRGDGDFRVELPRMPTPFILLWLTLTLGVIIGLIVWTRPGDRMLPYVIFASPMILGAFVMLCTWVNRHAELVNPIVRYDAGTRRIHVYGSAEPIVVDDIAELVTWQLSRKQMKGAGQSTARGESYRQTLAVLRSGEEYSTVLLFQDFAAWPAIDDPPQALAKVLGVPLRRIVGK